MPEPTIRPGSLQDLLVIEPAPIPDERGFFVRTMSAEVLRTNGIEPASFVQENQSRSRHRTLRGLHFRRELRERKIVRCARGEVFAVVVDLRPWSATFGRWEPFRLDDRDHRQIVVPTGCGLGFQVLTDWADICYKHDAVYAPELDGSITWNDPDLRIAWPLAEPILSQRDRTAPNLAEIRPLLASWFGDRPPVTDAVVGGSH
jgi:dTDP-4-dehydrorhamnose 3,5-epimerase